MKKWGDGRARVRVGVQRSVFVDAWPGEGQQRRRRCGETVANCVWVWIVSLTKNEHKIGENKKRKKSKVNANSMVS